MEIPYKYKGENQGQELAFNRVIAISEHVEELTHENMITSKRTKSFSLDDPIRDIFEWALKECLQGDLQLYPDESSKEKESGTS